MNTIPCPDCSHLEPVGTFSTKPSDKKPLKPFRVSTSKDGGLLTHGYFDTLEMARAGACGTTAEIHTRQP